MIPPYQQRGQPISPSAFNALIDMVRSAQITGIVGGTFQRSIGGTTINVAPQSSGSSATSADAPCPFSVADASEMDGETLVLKVVIGQDPILGTISEDFPEGRYPDGMSGAPDAPPYVVTIAQEEGVEYVYVNVQVDQRNAILTPSTAITVSVESTFTQGSSTYQKFLVAIIEKVLDEESNPYISQITNVCPIVYQRPAPTCPFLVEDDSRDGECRVTVRSGLVANALPDDMTLNDTFTVTLADTSDFWVIYCGMVLVDGVIQTDPGNITIFASDQYEESTAEYVYFKLAELNVSLTEAGDRYVSYILNTCAVPFVAGGATAAPCAYFRVTDATEAEILRVEVAQSQIAGRWPDGMGIGFPPFYLELAGNSYIYAGIYWDVTTLTIGPDSDAITILQSDELLQNTDTMQYILLATVVTGGSPITITQINNVCSQPQPNPCLLDWSAA
jgi:hypothetical protein